MALVVKPDKHEFDVKRFYLPEFKVDVNCPHCDKRTIVDSSGLYLSYPSINKKQQIYILCKECDEHFEMDIELEMSITIHTENPRK